MALTDQSWRVDVSDTPIFGPGRFEGPMDSYPALTRHPTDLGPISRRQTIGLQSSNRSVSRRRRHAGRTDWREWPSRTDEPPHGNAPDPLSEPAGVVWPQPRTTSNGAGR